MTIFKGIKNNTGIIYLPLPLNKRTRIEGGVEQLSFGANKFKVKIPKDARVGRLVQIKNIAHYIDPMLSGDICLVVTPVNQNFYSNTKDVTLQIRFDFYSFNKQTIKKLKIGDKYFNVTIPLGITPGMSLRLKNMASLINGGFPGDIYLKLLPIERSSWKCWGIFNTFGNLQDTKISAKFSIPTIFELAGEWIFKKEPAEIIIKK